MAARLIDRLDRLVRAGETTQGLNPVQWEALRYLQQANRFSRTPAALAAYLASTRGTVSQTLIALESKGFIRREASDRDKRSIKLSLTRMGERALRHDPLLGLAHDIEYAAGGRAADIAEILRGTLQQAIARNRGRAFGACYTCKYFRSNVRTSEPPHQCSLLDEPLSANDSERICFEQESTSG